MVLNATETVRLITGTGRRGTGGRGMKLRDRGDYNAYRYTVTTSDSSIKMGSDESHFIVSLIVRDKVSRQKSTNHSLQRDVVEMVGYASGRLKQV